MATIPQFTFISRSATGSSSITIASEDNGDIKITDLAGTHLTMRKDSIGAKVVYTAVGLFLRTVAKYITWG